MSGDAGLSKVRELGHDVPRIAWAKGEKVKHGTSCRVRDRKENIWDIRTGLGGGACHAFDCHWTGCRSDRWFPSGSVKYPAIPNDASTSPGSLNFTPRSFKVS